MKTNTTSKTGGKALGQSEQFTAQTGVSKYIVILHGGKEQVVTFPFEAKHADVFGYVRQECREAVQAISAGFFISERDSFWSGGESDSLNLPSRQRTHDHRQHRRQSHASQLPSLNHQRRRWSRLTRPRPFFL